jgi:hypothetical protein
MTKGKRGDRSPGGEHQGGEQHKSGPPQGGEDPKVRHEQEARKGGQMEHRDHRPDIKGNENPSRQGPK